MPQFFVLRFQLHALKVGERAALERTRKEN